MAAYTLPDYPGNGRLLSTAGGGTALTITRTFINIPADIMNVECSVRSLTTAIVAKIAFNPLLNIFRTTDGFATAPTNETGAYSTITLNSMPTLANGGAIYIGTAEPISGLNITVGNTNSGGGTMGLFYWNGTAWTDTSVTDGTTNLSASGNATFTVPTAWVPGQLSNILNIQKPSLGQKLYWLRWTTSVAFDASVTVTALYPINRYVDALPEYVVGGGPTMHLDRNSNGGSIQALVNGAAAEAGTLIVNGFYPTPANP